MDKQKTLASPARVPSVFGGLSRLATVPPRTSVLSPGAGNEPKKAIKAQERANKGEEVYVAKAVRLDRHVDAAAIARHDDGDRSAVLAIELAQFGLQTGHPPERSRAVSAV
jgi:hypothetical protein